MFKGIAKVTSGIDNTDLVKRLLDDLDKKQVYVGIPEEGNAPHGSVTNAELLYIQTHGARSPAMIEEMKGDMDSGMKYSKAYSMYIQSNGSPLWRIPPRPVIEPAIEHNKAPIAKQLKKVAQTALNGQDPTQELHKAGMLGQNIARGWFTDPANEWPANAPSTIEAKGSENPLIDTGELRKSIVYVVKG